MAASVEAQGARAVCCQADVSAPEQIQAMFDTVADELGVVTGLVNNAGLNIRDTLADQSLEDWSEILAVDLTGPFLCTKAAVPGMLDVGRGSAVTVSSIAGITVNLPARASG